MNFYRKFAGFVAVSGLFVFFGATSAFAESTAVVSTDVINVRASATTESEVLGKLTSGQTVEIIDVENDWFIIKHSPDKAYITSQFATVTKAEAVITSDNVNVRQAPSTDSTKIGSVNVGDKVMVTGVSGDFYAVEQNGLTAYIHKDYVIGNLLNYVPAAQVAAANTVAPAKAATATADSTVYALVSTSGGVNLRSASSKDSSVLTVLSNGDAADVLELGPEWHKISFNGIVGYVNAEYVSIENGSKPASGQREALVGYAKQFIGVPYVYGSTSLSSGVDCSGFVYCVYKNFDITLSRSSSSQVNDGTRVKSKADLIKGDLVFFDTEGSNNGNITHVGIYIGNGQFIHASSGKAKSVTISGLEDDYYSGRFVAAARILK